MKALPLLLIALLAPVQEARKPVDLTRFLDADKDSIAGDWTLDGGVLASPKRARPPRIHLLQIPYVPPEEYDLTLVVESRGPFDPKGETTSLDVGLPFGSARTLVVIDGWNGTIGGLMGLHGKSAADNETKLSDRVFTDATARTLVFSVRKGSIGLTLDGKSLIDWKGSPSDFHGRIYDGMIPDSRAFYLGAWIGYTFRKLELTPVTGSGSVVARRLKSRTVGGGGGGDFEDLLPSPALLTGIRYWISPWGANPIVKCVQGLYRGEDGPVEGKVYGNPRTQPNEIVAKPGYAIGGFVAKGGSRVDGLKVLFMRIGEKGLDPKDAYESDWIGGRGGGDETTIGGDGVPIVTLSGRSGEDLDCIGVIQSEVSPGVLDPLRTLSDRLQSAEPEVRQKACERLGRMGADALPALDALTERLKEDAAPKVRLAAAAAIGRIGPPALIAVPALMEGLRQPDAGVKAGCAAALGRLGPAARPALPSLIDALDSTDLALRRAAFLSLCSLGPDGAAIPRLLQVLRNDVVKDETIRPALNNPDDWMSGPGMEGPALGSVWVSLRALAGLGKDAVPGLASGLQSEDVLYRGICGVLLAMMGPEARAALPSLLTAMQDKEPSIRRLAIKAAQEVDARAPGLLTALKEASKDADEGVKELAKEALHRFSPLSVRLKTGDRFRVASTVKQKSDAGGTKAEFDWTYVIEYEVQGPEAGEVPDELRDLAAPPGFDLAEYRAGGSPSGAFRTLTLRFVGQGRAPETALRFFSESLPRNGWILEGRDETPADRGPLVGVRRGERIVVSLQQAAALEALVVITPLRGGRSAALETSTDQGPVQVVGRYVAIKVSGTDPSGPVGEDWNESKGPLPEQSKLRVYALGQIRTSMDRRGCLGDLVRDPLTGLPVFPGASLGMAGALPEDSGRKEDRWTTTLEEGQGGPAELDHRFTRQDATEIVLATTARYDRAEGTGTPVGKGEGSATTTLDPRSGLPLKSEGRYVHTSEGSRLEVTFQTVFTKIEK